MRPVEQLRMMLSSLPGVEQVPSRFGSRRSPAWVVSGREFAHLHADDRIDLRLPRKLQTSLESDARAHFRKGASQWLEFEFHSESDAVDAAKLARQAWAAAK
jgi:hypothetical protein